MKLTTRKFLINDLEYAAECMKSGPNCYRWRLRSWNGRRVGEMFGNHFALRILANQDLTRIMADIGAVEYVQTRPGVYEVKP